MGFKSKLFFSSKKSKSGSSSPNSTNSPTSIGSNSPVGSNKKKSKSNSKEETRSPNPKKDGLPKGKEASFEVHSSSPGKSNLSSSGSEAKKKVAETQPSTDVKEGSASPISASSLGLNRIKIRSSPLPREIFFSFETDYAIPVLPCCKLSKLDISSGSVKQEDGSSKLEVNQKSRDIGTLRSNNPALPASRNDQFKASPSISGPVGSLQFGTPENSYESEYQKDSESPRYQALLRMTSAPRKKFPGDIKSFSHELNSKGVRPFPLWKPRRSYKLEEIVNLIGTKFDKAKEEVDSDLRAFGGDLFDIYEKNKDSHPELLETIEDLLVLAETCAKTTSGDFWLQCEGIVQDLDDRRQELPPGVLKQLHTRMLFILTRCTRLLQFHKESWGQEENAIQLHQSRVLHPIGKGVPTEDVRDGRGSSTANALKVKSTKKAFSQEQYGLNRNEGFFVRPAPTSLPYNEIPKDSESTASIDKMSSWKRLPSPASKSVQEAAVMKEQNVCKVEPSQVVKNQVAMSDDMAVSPSIHKEHMSKHRHNISWGYWGDQSCISEESFICRICEEEVPTTHVQDHSRICALADIYDQKGTSVDERLAVIAVTLEKITENFIQKDSLAAVESLDGMKISNASGTEKFDVLSPKLSDWSRRGSEDMLECFPEADNSVFIDDMRYLPSMSCRTRFGPKSDHGTSTSSASSMTPRSPIPPPRPDPVELLLGGKGTFHDQDDIPQMSDLADIARCAANVVPVDDQSIQLLLSCLEHLRVVIDHRKFDALIVETFGTRIQKLIREKYIQLCELLGDEKVDLSNMIDEDAPLEDDVFRSLRTSPVHPRDRTSIDDFEIVKGISRGAFGHVVLARKKSTGDLFAIKVLKKADIIRKNAVESILAERDILINAHNPFVVRFFYSFTDSENLYLVMEYLNGGDFYSMLRKLGCLDESNARVYIAEVVLALEYLHSEGVVHRDLKPDNLLIAHDGHVKLTDFGLSKVGLINNTDDLSGPLSSATSMLVEQKPNFPTLEHKRSAVGTPDYLAPEILLGTGHGATADWWSVGIILYELIVGIPPFNADHSQQIFDNILNRNIQWPPVPEYMSHEARDLIDRLLTEDPHQRLGARGAAEVKQHMFFKDINWHTLAQQKAAFVPDSENAFDTSYFHCRYSWNYSEEQSFPTNEIKDSSDGDSSSGSSDCLSNHHDEEVEVSHGPSELEAGVSENDQFNNFSFKNLTQLAYINNVLMSKDHKDESQTNSHRR